MPAWDEREKLQISKKLDQRFAFFTHSVNAVLCDTLIQRRNTILMNFR